jgi:orotidine-5'-phosphate decarboxylase
MNALTAPQRLIVAADYKPEGGNGRIWFRNKVLRLADELHGTGVYIKLNTILRAFGYDMIHEVHDRGLLVFADLKVFDIADTLTIDGILLQEFKPELLTAVCTVGVKGLRALKAQLPDTEVLGVTVLTDLTNDDTGSMFSCTTLEAALRFAQVAADGNANGLISSGHEVEALKAKFEMLFTYNTPAIRPAWANVVGDGQNKARVMTPAEAIRAGATRIVVGRPITQSDNPRDAVLRTLDEIASVV